MGGHISWLELHRQNTLADDQVIQRVVCVLKDVRFSELEKGGVFTAIRAGSAKPGLKVGKDAIRAIHEFITFGP